MSVHTNNNSDSGVSDELREYLLKVAAAYDEYWALDPVSQGKSYEAYKDRVLQQRSVSLDDRPIEYALKRLAELRIEFVQLQATEPAEYEAQQLQLTRRTLELQGERTRDVTIPQARRALQEVNERWVALQAWNPAPRIRTFKQQQIEKCLSRERVIRDNLHEATCPSRPAPSASTYANRHADMVKSIAEAEKEVRQFESEAREAFALAEALWISVGYTVGKPEHLPQDETEREADDA